MPSAPKLSRFKLGATVAYLAAWPALQLWLSGDWFWVEGWIFECWFLVLCATCIGWLFRRDPALLAERYRQPGSGGQSGTDKFIVYGLFLGFIGWIVLPSLGRRLGWPRLPLGVEAVGGILLLAAAFFFFRSFTDNTFLSPLVRIQHERRHHVVSTGVYGLVRHPMYLGASMMFLGGPLLLGSSWGLLLGAGLVLLLMVRIAGEEKVLTRDLDGYEAYRGKVRYRLVPGVW